MEQEHRINQEVERGNFDTRDKALLAMTILGAFGLTAGVITGLVAGFTKNQDLYWPTVYTCVSGYGTFAIGTLGKVFRDNVLDNPENRLPTGNS